MSVLQGYLKGDLPKKQLIASIVEQFKLNLENTKAPLVEHLRKARKTEEALFCSLMLQNLIKNSILDFLFAILAYMQGGL